MNVSKDASSGQKRKQSQLALSVRVLILGAWSGETMGDYEHWAMRQTIEFLRAEINALKQRVKDLEDERRKI